MGAWRGGAPKGGAGALKCARLGSLSCETPAAPPDRATGARTRQPENSKRAHFRAPALQNTTKIPREDPQRDRNSETVAGKGRKSAKFWAPHPSGAPPFRGPTLSGPTLRGSTFLGLGPHPSGTPPFWAPTLRGSTLRGSTLRGSTLRGSTLRGSTLRGSTLRGSTLRGSTLRSSTLRGSTFLGGAPMGGAPMGKTLKH